MNVYDYVHENFSQDDRVQVDVESGDFTMGGVTFALVRVSHADPTFLLHRMENILQSSQAVRVDSGGFRISHSSSFFERRRL